MAPITFSQEERTDQSLVHSAAVEPRRPPGVDLWSTVMVAVLIVLLRS
jgi:hypothetical protein